MWLGATAPGTAALAEQVRVSLDQAYSIGRTAVAQRNYPLAFAVATGLLDANPKDPRALTLMAASAPHVGQPKQGRLDARDAYRLSPTKARKREAALYAAVAAAKEERSLTAQLWLRRAYQNSETEQHRSSIGRQYRQYARPQDHIGHCRVGVAGAAVQRRQSPCAQCREFRPWADPDLGQPDPPDRP